VTGGCVGGGVIVMHCNLYFFCSSVTRSTRPKRRPDILSCRRRTSRGADGRLDRCVRSSVAIFSFPQHQAEGSCFDEASVDDDSMVVYSACCTQPAGYVGRWQLVNRVECSLFLHVGLFVERLYLNVHEDPPRWHHSVVLHQIRRPLLDAERRDGVKVSCTYSAFGCCSSCGQPWRFRPRCDQCPLPGCRPAAGVGAHVLMAGADVSEGADTATKAWCLCRNHGAPPGAPSASRRRGGPPGTRVPTPVVKGARERPRRGAPAAALAGVCIGAPPRRRRPP